MMGESRDIASVKTLLEEHPYSHLLRLAYLQLLKGSDSILFEEEVSKASYHLPSRAVLHDLWSKEEEVSESSEKQSADAVVEVQDSAYEKEPQEIVEQKEEQVESTPELEQQYLTEAVHSSILLEVDAKNVEEEPKPDESRIHQKTEKPKNFLEFISGDNEASVSLEEDLIDKFLSGKTNRPKKEFFSPEKMAKKSLEDKEGMVSDTLARIYINQGNYSKAIDAYERLILKYPEKSDYFAARIEKVKDLKRIKR